MNCQNCGSPLTTEDQFCKSCGAPVNNQVAQNINPANTGVDTSSMGAVQSQPQSVVEPSTVIQIGEPTPVTPVAPVQEVAQQPVQPTTPMTPVMPQPQMAPQAPMAQPQPVNTGSKSNLILIIVGAVAALAIIALAIVFVPKLFNKNDGGGSGNNNATPISPASSYKINYSGFTFTIPDTYKYEEKNGELLIADNSETWIVELAVASGDYGQIKGKLANLHNHFEQNGYVSAPAELKTINGTEFITIELQMSGTNMLGAYVKLNSMNFAFIIIFSQDNTFAYDVLNNIEPIMKNSVYNAAANNISVSILDEINMYDFISIY